MKAELKVIKWIKDCIDNDQWRTYELHIDDVYQASPKKLWLKQALEMLEIANNNIFSKEFEVLLSIQLKEVKEIKYDIVSLNSINIKDFSYTPPSLYIIKKEQESQFGNIVSEENAYRIFLTKRIGDGNLIYRSLLVIPNRLSLTYQE